MNKPRSSVLYLFDPLKTPSTPRRESSPDSGSSDKENDAPGELTVFFNRMQTYQKHTAPTTPNDKLIDFDALDDAVVPETTTNADILQNGAGQGSSLVSDTCTPGTSPLQRIPLADVVPQEALGMGNTSRPQSLPMGVSSQEGSFPVETATPAPSNTPLARVINSINLAPLPESAAESLGSAPLSDVSGSILEEQDEDEDEEEAAYCGEAEDTVAIPLSFPQITVSSPAYNDSISLTEGDLPPTSDSPTDRLFASSSSVSGPPIRRPLLDHYIATDDPRRVSVDLQTSFSMHMQSDEMSFDLLNDKISFLGMAHGGESFWAAGEEEFDMKVEEQKMEAAAREYELSGKATREKEHQKKATTVLTPPRQSEMATALEISLKSRSTAPDSQVVMPVFQQLPVFNVPVEIAESVAEEEASDLRTNVVDIAHECKEANVDRKNSVESTASERNFEAMNTQLVPLPMPTPQIAAATPAPLPVVPNVPVPALRIMKKTWKVHGRTDSAASVASSISSSGSTSSTSASSASTTVTSVSSDFSVAAGGVIPATVEKIGNGAASSSTNPTLAPRATKTIIRGVQRPPLGMEISSSVPSANNTMPARIEQRAVVPTKLRPRPSIGAAAEARGRFAAAGVQRPNLQQGQRAMPSHLAQAGSAPKAQKPASTTNATTTSGMTARRVPSVSTAGGIGSGVSASGVKAPIRYPGIGTASGSSALPRPVSRLPTPGTLVNGVKKLSNTGMRRPAVKKGL